VEATRNTESATEVDGAPANWQLHPTAVKKKANRSEGSRSAAAPDLIGSFAVHCPNRPGPPEWRRPGRELGFQPGVSTAETHKAANGASIRAFFNETSVTDPRGAAKPGERRCAG